MKASRQMQLCLNESQSTKLRYSSVLTIRRVRGRGGIHFSLVRTHEDGAMTARLTPDAGLSTRELRDLQRLAGFMVPADVEYGVPGADDEIIFADIIRSLGRDAQAVRAALQMLQEIAVGNLDSLDAKEAETAMLTLLRRDDSAVKALGR